jgi:branched-chain amino acid transport system permease protein
MRMVIFSLALILIILFRREGIMGMRELSWDMLFSRGSRARNHDEEGEDRR